MRTCQDIVTFQREKKKTVPFEDGRLSMTCRPGSYNRCFSSQKLVNEWIEDQHWCDDVMSIEVVIVSALQCIRMLTVQRSATHPNTVPGEGSWLMALRECQENGPQPV